MCGLQVFLEFRVLKETLVFMESSDWWLSAYQGQWSRPNEYEMNESTTAKNRLCQGRFKPRRRIIATYRNLKMP